jgi:hypothetical protein
MNMTLPPVARADGDGDGVVRGRAGARQFIAAAVHPPLVTVYPPSLRPSVPPSAVGGVKQSTFCMARRKTMITMGSLYFIWIDANVIISSWDLRGAVCVAPSRVGPDSSPPLPWRTVHPHSCYCIIPHHETFRTTIQPSYNSTKG